MLPNMLAIEKAKSMRSGKQDLGKSFQNEIPLSLCLAWRVAQFKLQFWGLLNASSGEGVSK